MFPANFDESNGFVSPSQALCNGDLSAISIYQGENESGRTKIVSCWKPTQKEIDEIVETGQVWVTVAWPSLPPVAVDGISPFQVEDEP